MELRISSRCAFVLAWGIVVPAVASAQTQAVVAAETFEEWMSELSNWGRWGDDDQLGTVNLITPEKRVKAARLVVSGISISLARDLEKEEALHNPFPFRHEMDSTGRQPAGGEYAEDTYSITYHGLAHSHLDALCHVFHEGRMYNGRDQNLVTEAGCEVLSVAGYSGGFFTRGVLIDIPWLKGVTYLEPGTPIYPEDLDAWSAKAGIEVRAGDVVLIRTGRWARHDEKGSWNAIESLQGLHASAVKWLRERDVAVVGSDAGSDVLPSGVQGQFGPVHKLLIVAMGTPIFDNLNLEELSREAQRQHRWEFLFTAAPIRVQGGTGSPLNPIAIF